MRASALGLMQWMLVGGGLAACGTAEDLEVEEASLEQGAERWAPGKADEASVQGEARRILVVASGGYGSCERYGPRDMNMYPAVKILHQRLQAKHPKAEIASLISCFREEAPTVGEAWFVIGDSNQLDWAPARELYRYVLGLAGDDTAIYLIGHSYGGWQAMAMALQLDNVAPGRVAGLYTIDPISPNQCGTNMIRHMVGAGIDMATSMMTMGFFGTDVTEGCQMAPRDMPWNLGAFVDRFYNFFQRGGGYLQSSPMPSANNFAVPGASHVTIQYAAAVWENIEASISADLSR